MPKHAPRPSYALISTARGGPPRGQPARGRESGVATRHGHALMQINDYNYGVSLQVVMPTGWIDEIGERGARFATACRWRKGDEE